MNHQRGTPIGELLVARGLLTSNQVEQILEEQRQSDRPFGDLAERMFGVSPNAIEDAWADQYVALGTEADLAHESVDPSLLRLLTRRQAWQFRLLPLRREYGGLVVATCRTRLPRAAKFASVMFREPVHFLIAPSAQLEEYLGVHYPFPGVLDLVGTGAHRRSVLPAALQ